MRISDIRRVFRNRVYAFTYILARNICKICMPLDEIPHGWKTVSKFEFVDGVIPDEVQRLPLLDGCIHSEIIYFFKKAFAHNTSEGK